jgi:crossover junction endodeoxyribonuclease RuvC
VPRGTGFQPVCPLPLYLPQAPAYNAHMVTTRLMGIDPGLGCTGYGVVDRLEEGHCRLVEGGAVRTPASAPLALRLQAIYDGICEAVVDLQPQMVVVESLYSQYRHPRTALLMGHARGVIYLAAQVHGLTVEAYPASQVKRALTGAGRAGKQQVAEMVCRLLGLTEIPQPPDVTDALALALCHARPDRFGGEGNLPPAVQAALAGAGQALPSPQISRRRNRS